MMKTILESMFEGELFPSGMITPENPEYHQLNNEIVHLMEKWQKKLPEDDYELLEELLELINKSNMMEAVSSVTYGFRLCAALLVEVLICRGELARKG